ncbi:MAG TPA: Uma2 family endonuclease [Chthoniobacteraceae bacterium]|jgi:Uma2 family endonuclease
MQAGASKPIISAQDYLRLEREAPFKSEYVHGEIFAMAGGTVNHHTLVGNFYGLLWQQLAGRSCRAFTSDMKVRCDFWDSFVYPDISAACEPLTFFDEQRDAFSNPSLVVEVLSKGTEAYDRGEKFRLYRMIPSLVEYVLVSQRQPLVEVFRRIGESQWQLETFDAPESVFHLHSVDVEISLLQLIANVEFTTE